METSVQTRSSVKLWVRVLPLRNKTSLPTKVAYISSAAAVVPICPEKVVNPNFLPLGVRPTIINKHEQSPETSVHSHGVKLSVRFLPLRDKTSLPTKVAYIPSAAAAVPIPEKVANPNFLPLGVRPTIINKHKQQSSLDAVPVVKYELNVFQRVEDSLSPYEWEQYALKYSSFADSISAFNPAIRDRVVQSRMDRYCGGYTLDAVDRKHTKAVIKRGGCADAKGKFRASH